RLGVDAASFQASEVFGHNRPEVSQPTWRTCDSSTLLLRRDGGTGRRDGLKIRWPQGRGSSNLPPGSKDSSKLPPPHIVGLTPDPPPVSVKCPRFRRGEVPRGARGPSCGPRLPPSSPRPRRCPPRP